MSKSTVEASLRMLEAIATLADAAMVLAETLQESIRREDPRERERNDEDLSDCEPAPAQWTLVAIAKAESPWRVDEDNDPLDSFDFDSNRDRLRRRDAARQRMKREDWEAKFWD